MKKFIPKEKLGKKARKRQEGPQAARQRAAHHLDVFPGDEKGGKQKALQPQEKSS